MKKRLLILVAVAALMVMTLAIPASANQSDCEGSLHPGHCGYVASGMKNTNAAPVNHFHRGVDLAPLYATGAGEWGKAVSAAAKGQGLPKAHAPG